MFATKTIDTKVHQILIVEDEPDIYLLLDLLLDSKNIKTTHIKNLSDALQYLKQEQPSLILLDNRLPDGYGVDFIEHIKTNYPMIKIIMISGVDASTRDFALACGADHFLHKPFTQKQLHSAIDTVLN